MAKEKPATKKCKKCQTEIPYNAKKCPHCLSKQGMALWLKALIVIIIVFGIAGISGGTTGTSGSNVNNNGNVQQETVKKDKFTIEGDTTSDYDGFALYIEGVIKNNTDKDMSYVQVTFNLYDAEGNQIGTALDNINNLKAGGTWKFKAMGIENATSYELAEITGF